MDADTHMEDAGEATAAPSTSAAASMETSEGGNDGAAPAPVPQGANTQEQRGAQQQHEDEKEDRPAELTQKSEAGKDGSGEAGAALAAGSEVAATDGAAKGARKSGAGSERPTREDPAAAEKLRAYVASLGGTLPEGWVGVYRMRTGGNSAGQYDLHYKNPEGRIFRSRVEVLRSLGIDPSGGAAGSAGGEAGSSKKAAAGSAGTGKAPKKRSTKKEQSQQPQPEAMETEGNGEAAAATTTTANGAEASAQDGALSPRPRTPGSGKWTLPPEIPREEAVAAAKQCAAELELKPPFTTDKGAIVLDLGSFRNDQGYYDATHIWPVGYRAAWKPPPEPAASNGGGSRKRKSTAAAKPTAGTDGAAATTITPAEAPAGEEPAKVEAERPAGEAIDGAAEANGGASSGATVAPPPQPTTPSGPPPPAYRFISEIRESDAGPSFVVLLEQDPERGATAADGPSGDGSAVTTAPAVIAEGAAAAAAEPLLVHSASSPEAAWNAVAELQTAAIAAVKKAKSGATARTQPTPVQRALAAVPPIGKVWGPDCFGLADVRVLQLLEALPGVEDCEEYFYVQQRNSWELEAAAIATKRNVVLATTTSNRRTAAAASKQRKRQQQMTMETFADRAAAGTAPPVSQGTAGREGGDGGPENLEAAAGAADKAAAVKKATPKPKSTGGAAGGGGGKGEKANRMPREEYEVRSVLDRLVERVSLVMAEPDENERQKLLKAMEKLDRAAARRRERTAEKAAEKAAAGGADASAATAGESGAAPTSAAAAAGAPASGEKKSKKKKSEKKGDEEGKKDEKAGEAAAKTQKPPKAPKVPKTPKTPKDSTAAVTAAGADAEAAAAKEATATATPPAAATSATVDERTLNTADIPAPPGLSLELSYPAAAAAAAAAVAGPLPGGSSSSLTALAKDSDGSGLLGSDEVQQLLLVYQFLWDHRKLLGLDGRVPSLADLLVMVSEPPARLPAPARRASDELHLALVRLLVGEALDELLAYTAETSNLGRRDLSAATPPMTAATWPELARRYLAAAAAARYLTTSEPRSSALASLKLPGQLQNLEPADWLHYLLSGLNFPHLLSRIALLPHASSRWAADALLTADDARARAAAERFMRGGVSYDMQDMDGEGQVRRGRRLLNALLTLPEGGEQLGFYAPEFGEVVKAPRGLDLHAVAARLDAGLYQNTDDWLQAVATDVRSALGLWRAALSCPKGRDIPGHQDAKASLADVAERKLDEMLANKDTALALPAPKAAAAVATDGDVEMRDASEPPEADGAATGGGAAGGGGSGKSRKGRSGGSRRRKKGGEGQAAEAEAADEGEAEDPSSLDDPTRLFNPRGGCRVCWLDEDKNRLLLCDGCDGEYHCYCVEPPLLEVPEGAWFCPSCTARGLGPPKTEGEEADEAAGASSPTAPAKAGSMDTSPAQGGGGAAAGRSPCSPAFQHTHSHSHLVAELQDRPAALQQQLKRTKLEPQHKQQELAAGGRNAGSRGGSDGAVPVDEGPLFLPLDIPEGPRVTLQPHSRPGLKELAGLLRLAHLLGNYDYATGALAAEPDGSGRGGLEGWTPSRRLALLAALCDLALDTNALRESLEEVVEGRKRARVEANAIRSKARQIQEEQVAAKKAAAEKENAPKEADGADANAAPAGKEAKGKGKGKKDAKAATGEEGTGQEVKEGGTTKLSRHIRTDLSVLPEAELKRLMSLEAQVEGLDVRVESIGEDRHGSRYWWLGADQVNPQGLQGVVLVEQVPVGKAAADDERAERAFAERQRRRQVEEQEAQKRKQAEEERKRKKAAAAAAVAAAAAAPDSGADGGEAAAATAAAAAAAAAAAEEEEQELDEWGLPLERPRPRIVAIGSDCGPGASWGMYHNPEQLNLLVGWLNPKGMREGPLRTALLRVRDRIAASQALAGDKPKKKQEALQQKQQQQQQDPQAESAPTEQGQQSQPQLQDADVQPMAPPPPPPPILCLNVTATGGGGGGSRRARQGSAAPADGGAAAGAADGSGDEPPAAPEEAVVLRNDLLAVYRGLPVEAFSRFWGSAERQSRWSAFVEGATTPQQLSAALTVLESMLVDEALKPHWRLYCLPAQHPQLCTTWAAVGYRLAGLQGAIRKQILPPRELHHQQAAETAAAPERGGKAGRGGPAGRETAARQQKEQQQERYPSRRGGAAATALPDISNVRSREAAALLSANTAKASGKASGKGGKKDAAANGGDGGRGQKRQRVSSEEEDEEVEEVELRGRKDADRRRGKRAATAASKAASQRAVSKEAAKGRGRSGSGRGQHAEEREDGEAEDDDEEEPDAANAEEEKSGGEDSEAEASDASEEEGEESGKEDEEDEDSSSDEEEEEEEDDGVGKKRRAQPTRVSARLHKKEPEPTGPRTRGSSQRQQPKPDASASESEEDEEDKEEEEEEDVRPAKRQRGGAGGREAARVKGRTRTAVVSSDDEEDQEEDGQAEDGVGRAGKGRARGSANGSVAATAPAAAAGKAGQADGAKGGGAAVGARAAAIIANRKRALADWSEEESEEEQQEEEADARGKEGKKERGKGARGGSAAASSSEEEEEDGEERRGKARGGARVAAGKRDGGSSAAAAAAGRRGIGRLPASVSGAGGGGKKPSAAKRSMARSEVEYDVEDFDDLNT